MQPTRKLPNALRRAQLFSNWGEGLVFEIFGDFGVPTMFSYIVPTRFSMAPNDVLGVFLKFLTCSSIYSQ
jgi:hypothetical protein